MARQCDLTGRDPANSLALIPCCIPRDPLCGSRGQRSGRRFVMDFPRRWMASASSSGRCMFGLIVMFPIEDDWCFRRT